ncbi:rhamnogalacturonan acetylesterase [Mucilaginibacter sp. HMF5004]|uniref:rhamnogalacturonan acetylesterase n=1 Tax=Mucilaginibacter rivuli TaxID=2857527 RepID=UPI001C5E9C83|nr:rhamnogalacturonan acetylesterase [Mucilaginibacter rivuli]MBW4891527.1 rhamnogalacturonan acetylesterase [Mucilaginibacter rivuli]
MKFIKPIAFILLTAILVSWTKLTPIKVYMIGDSTMANKSPGVYPETGWGQVFKEYFTGDVTIDNRAQNGRSTKSFINEKRWDDVMSTLQAGDYVIIEFGHNDEKVEKPNTGTTIDEFKANLLKFVTDARGKGATPILMTPVTRRSFKDGVLTNSHGLYPDAVRDVATKNNVAFVDMLQKSEKLVKAMGEAPSQSLWNWADSGVYKGFPKGVKDNTHFNPTGAHKMAELAVEGLKELKLPLTAYLKP